MCTFIDTNQLIKKWLGPRNIMSVTYNFHKFNKKMPETYPLNSNVPGCSDSIDNQ